LPVSLIGDEFTLSFPKSRIFEINDVENSDVIDISLEVIDLKFGPESTNGKKPKFTGQTALSMSEQRARMEEKVSLSLPVMLQPHSRYINAYNKWTEDDLPVELGLSLVYTDDIDEPSVANFIACGLCMCPQQTPIAGTTSRNPQNSTTTG
jgi:hypothetical protein